MEQTQTQTQTAAPRAAVGVVVLLALTFAFPSSARATGAEGLGGLVGLAAVGALLVGAVSIPLMASSLGQDRPAHPFARAGALIAAGINLTLGTLALCLTPYFLGEEEDSLLRVIGFVYGGLALVVGIAGGILALMRETRDPVP